MVQHLLLMLVAAPLLVLGAPPVAIAWAVPQAWRRDLGRWWRRQKGLSSLWRLLTHPAVVWTLHAMALWLWHLPFLYQAALGSELVHALEHGSFLGTALLFWWVVAQRGHHSRMGYGLGLLFTFTTAMHSGLLGALLTFARQAWYPAYAESAPAWGLTILEDQQLAGAIMWLPAGVIYLVATLALLGLWLQAMEKR
jgi:putative membrane protein